MDDAWEKGAPVYTKNPKLGDTQPIWPLGVLPDFEPDFGLADLLEPEIKEKKTQLPPKNNDGRKTCFWCQSPTEKRGCMKEYDVCTKKECGR